MRKTFVLLAVCLPLSLNIYAQCTPNAPTGTGGVTPTPNNVPCIERGVPYDITMQLENFTTIQGTVTINWARIDSLVNFPCGIRWQANKLQFNGGETGCIRVFGTTNDSVGQYPLGIYMTIDASILGFPIGAQSGEVGNLLAQIQSQFGINLGINIGYYSRVIEPGNSCPPIDTSINANNLYSSDTVCSTLSLSVFISGSTSICTGQSTTLTANASNATGPVTYSWSTGSTNQSITVSTANNYSVTVTDQNGSVSSSVTVTVNTKPTAAFSASASGQTVTITNTSTSGATYSWNFGDSQTSTAQNPAPHTYSTSGNYTITLIVTSAAGCKDTATQSVTIGCPLPDASFTVTQSGLTTTITNTTTGATTYSWNFGNGATSTAQNPPAQTYSSSGTYTITLIATNSCGSDTATEVITLTGILTVENTLYFDVYPNPSNGLLSLEFSANRYAKAYELSILDITGKKVFEQTFTGVSGAVQKQIDLSAFPKGVYELRLSSENGIGIKKIVLR